MPSHERNEPTQDELERDTDTALHEELLGADLEAPLPEELLDKDRQRVRRLGVSDGIVER